MPPRAWLVLLSAATAMASAPNFRFGVDYSELVPTGVATQARLFAVAVDSQGGIYVLMNSGDSTNYNLVKLGPGGDRVIYQNLAVERSSKTRAFGPRRFR